MSNDSELRSPKFNRATLYRIMGVVAFVGLGTFAVIQSMRWVGKPTDTAAQLQEQSAEGELSSNDSIGEVEDAAKSLANGGELSGTERSLKPTLGADTGTAGSTGSGSDELSSARSGPGTQDFAPPPPVANQPRGFPSGDDSLQPRRFPAKPSDDAPDEKGEKETGEETASDASSTPFPPPAARSRPTQPPRDRVADLSAGSASGDFGSPSPASPPPFEKKTDSELPGPDARATGPTPSPFGQPKETTEAADRPPSFADQLKQLPGNDQKRNLDAENRVAEAFGTPDSSPSSNDEPGGGIEGRSLDQDLPIPPLRSNQPKAATGNPPNFPPLPPPGPGTEGVGQTPRAKPPAQLPPEDAFGPSSRSTDPPSAPASPLGNPRSTSAAPAPPRQAFPPPTSSFSTPAPPGTSVPDSPANAQSAPPGANPSASSAPSAERGSRFGTPPESPSSLGGTATSPMAAPPSDSSFSSPPRLASRSGAGAAPPAGIPAGIPPAPRTNPGFGSNPAAPAAIRTQATPGDRHLEGTLTPQLTIEKIAPQEIQLHQTAEFQIVVRNSGKTTANEVQVYDQIPAGTELLSALPEPTRGANGQVQWDLGTMDPGQEKRIQLQLRPNQPGEIGSVAQVTFAAQASVRTLVTKPVLSITHSGPAKSLIGDKVTLDILVENRGDGPAREVVIKEDVPEQLSFQSGFRELEYPIGTLEPGQSRRIRLALTAAQAGRLINVLQVSGQGGLEAEHRIDMEVVAPQLVAESAGPTRRYLQREATHTFLIENRGTANATNVELTARLPRGLKYVSANNRGQYDANAHAVYWSLAELTPTVNASVALTTMPVEAGQQDIQFEVAADLQQRATVVQNLSVEHLNDFFFSIDDQVDPIEVGSPTEYQVRLVNQGTQAASNVRIQLDFPTGIAPTRVQTQFPHEIRGNQILFAPIASVPPGDEIRFVVSGQGVSPGDHTVKVQVQTDGRQTPVVKQESTHVYNDQ